MLIVGGLLLVGCGSPAESGTVAAPTVRLLFAGDVMLAGRVAPVVATEGPAVFEGARAVVSGANLAVANLESPLTTRPAATAGRDLRADPAAAALLAGAGFDVVALANNHAGDAGPETVADTTAAVRAAGLEPIGAGLDAAAAVAPLIVERGGLRVALLAFDLTGAGPEPDGTRAGVAHWDPELVAAAVEEARAAADLVAVGIHGGAEYLPAPDPALQAAVAAAAKWGADVVWAHGAHVAYPVELIDPDADDRGTVAAYGLGNFLFDQAGPRTDTGTVIEVLAGRDGVRAWRSGRVEHGDLRVRWQAWDLPNHPAAWLAGSWWSLAVGIRPSPARAVADLPQLGAGAEVIAQARGDLTGEDADDVVVAFRRPYRETLVNRAFPMQWRDAAGRTAHLGVYAAATLAPRWVAGSLPRPVAALAVCDGSLAVGYSTLGDPAVEAAAVWEWNGFGFTVGTPLPGEGSPACADVDGDGLGDPLVIDGR